MPHLFQVSRSKSQDPRKIHVTFSLSILENPLHFYLNHWIYACSFFNTPWNPMSSIPIPALEFFLEWGGSRKYVWLASFYDNKLGAGGRIKKYHFFRIFCVETIKKKRFFVKRWSEFFKNTFSQNAIGWLLLLLEKLIRNYRKITSRKLVQEIFFSKVSDMYWKLTFLGSIIQWIFSLNIQNTFSWILLIIYSSSVVFISPFLWFFDCKNRSFKQYIIETMFNEISGEKISHVGECSEAF